MNSCYFVIPNLVGGYSQLPMFETIENTNWQSISSAEHFQQLNQRKKFTLQDVTVLDINQPSHRENIDTINILISNGIFCVVGLLIRKFKSNSKVFYMVMFPSLDVSNTVSNIYLIRKHRETTGSIDKRFDIASKIRNQDFCKFWDIPHELVCHLDLPDSDESLANSLCYQLFVPRANFIQVIGNSSLRNEVLKNYEYNKLTGKLEVLVKSRSQLNRLERDTKIKARSSNMGPANGAGAVVLTDSTYQAFKASDDHDDYIAHRGVYGVRSPDSGGRVALYPMLLDASKSKTAMPVALSEMHTVTTIPDVFSVKHTFTTLSSAVHSFRNKCLTEGITGEKYEEMIAAVASKLLEDISWQIVAEECCKTQHFKTIKVDIDQVSMHVKKLKIYNFDYDMNNFLLLMYNSLLKEVFITKDVIQALLKVHHQSFKSDAGKNGGHTYMSSGEKKKYIPLISERTIGDVFHISVCLHNGLERDQNVEIVWKAHVFVTTFLETFSPGATYQQTICVKELQNDGNGYNHRLVSGPMLPILVCLFLSSTVEGGISIAIETFNNKLKAFFDFDETHVTSITELMAKSIADKLMDDWHFKMPCIIDRFSKWLEKHVIELGGVRFPSDHNKVIWGVGCTVSTVLGEKQPSDNNNVDVCQPINENNSQGNAILAKFSTESVHRGIMKNKFANSIPAYTVINYGLPPFVSLLNDPTKWFEGAPCNLLSGCIPENSDLFLQKETDDLYLNYDSDESLEFDNIDLVDGSVGVAETNTDVSVDHVKNIANKKQMFPCIALSCKKTHVTYPTHGGILPFEYQSTTTYWNKMPKDSEVRKLDNAIRSQCYNLSSRYAVGEYNVTLSSSKEVGCIFYDIFQENDNAVFNMETCKLRAKRFKDNNDLTLRDIEENGSPARIEIAFESPSSHANIETLVKGIFDTVNISLKHTKSYNVKPIVEVARFLLSGVLGKLKILEDMLTKHIATLAAYDELLCARLEVAAILRSYHSGKGKLKTKFVFAPKLAYLACRPILSRMMPLMDFCRKTTLVMPLVDMYDEFISGLLDISGNPHKRIEMPNFVRKYEEIFVQKYSCGQYCDKCFKTFSTQRTIDAFDTHSCKKLEKGRKMNVTDKHFASHYSNLENQLTSTQALLLIELKKGRNVFLTGYAGTGKSFTLTVAILYYLIEYGMYTFAVVSPTKVAAALVGGVTYHSFLQIESGTSTTVTDKGEEEYAPVRPAHVVRQDAIDKATKVASDKKDRHRYLFLKFGLRILFVDEVSMLSHDQMLYLDHYFRTIRQNDEPFGGLQVCLCGDALQLPPLVEQPKKTYDGVKPPRHPVYFFETISFLSGNFGVLYLTEIYRQKNPIFTIILNMMRDGICTQEICDHINNNWGDKVNKICALRVLFALHQQFDAEMLELKEMDNNTSFVRHGWESGKVEKLIRRMKKYWNDDLLLSYYKQTYNTSTNEKLDVDFTKSETFSEYYAHIDRLPVTEDDTVYNPVFTSENREVGAINQHYTFWRNIAVISVEAIDSHDRMNLQWNKFMSKKVVKCTKLETVLFVAVGQTVSFTSNDVDPNAANNSRGTVVDIKYVDGIVDCIVVAPFLSESGLTPHPIKVERKTRIVSYFDNEHGLIMLTRSQFPLRSADASTINTVQGSSLSEAHIVNSQRNSNCGFGRMYVACSRATSEDLVFILFKIKPADIVACPIALSFDMHHRPSEGAQPGLSEVNYSFLFLNGGKQCRLVPVNVK